MKRCSNPNCESSFLFGDSKTHCPFCHAPLVRNEGAAPAHPRITPVDAVLEDANEDEAPAFLTRRLGRVHCIGRITEIEHQALFYSKSHKLFNTIVRGEPYQFAHQSIEYTVRVEPITDGIPSEVTDFCLYGNYLGRLQVGDEVRIKAKNCRSRRIARSVYNLTTGSAVRPGAQIGAPLIRALLLSAVLLPVVAAWGIVYLVDPSAALSFLKSLFVYVLSAVVCIVGLKRLFHYIRSTGRERRRRQ